MKKYVAYIAAGLIGLVVLYVLDAWLLGTLSAELIDALRSGHHLSILPGSHPVPNPVALAPYYWRHPWVVAWAWATKTHLSNPDVRIGWLVLNGIILCIVLWWWTSRGSGLASQRPKDNRDITTLRHIIRDFDVKKIIASTSKDKIFLAVDDKRRLITVPTGKLVEHTYVLGPSGSGKTSLVVIPLCAQAIQRGFPTIVIDFKGDKQSVQVLAQEAAKAGKKFFFFTLLPGVAGNSYNPLANGSALSKVERIMTALQLIYEGAAKFYTYYQQSIFLPLIKYLDDNDVNYSLSDISYFLSNPGLLGDIIGEDVDEKQLKGLTAALTPFIDVKEINQPIGDIDLKQIMKDGDICYFDLRSAVAPELASAIGKMIAMDLQAIGAHRTEQDTTALIVIDEFQNMVCNAFRNIISKVRSARYAFVLANQALGDLKAIGEDFANTMMVNTYTKVVFTQEDPNDVDWFSRKSGQIISRSYSQSSSKGQNNESYGESLDERDIGYIHPNVLLSLPFGKSVIYRRGQLATVANHAHLISRGEKERLDLAPWPIPAVPHAKPAATRTAHDLVAESKTGLGQAVPNEPIKTIINHVPPTWTIQEDQDVDPEISI